MSYWHKSHWADPYFMEAYYRGVGGYTYMAVNGGGHGHWHPHFFNPAYFHPSHWMGTAWWLGQIPPISFAAHLEYHGSGKIWKAQQARRARPPARAPERPEDSYEELSKRLDAWREIIEAQDAKERRARKDKQGFIEALLEQIQEELDVDEQFAKVATARILAEMLDIAEELGIDDDDATVVALQLVD